MGYLFCFCTFGRELSGEYRHKPVFKERTKPELQMQSYKLPFIINQNVEHELLSPRKQKEGMNKMSLRI